MTSLATAIGGMNHWDWCPICRGGLDTGLECDQCGADFMPIYTAFKESLSGGNPGEPKACTPAEERGIGGATGAGQPPDGNPESTGDSADRRSPDGTERTPSPDESNRQHFSKSIVWMAKNRTYSETCYFGNYATAKAWAKHGGTVIPVEVFEPEPQAIQIVNGERPHEPKPSEAGDARFERGCHVIMDLMQAYERRVRSDCTTQEQIDKRPWECAQYRKASDYLRAVWPPHEPSAALVDDEGLVCVLASHLAKCDGHDDPNHLIWDGGPTPEPWGEVWCKYEEPAKEILRLVDGCLTPKGSTPNEPQGWQPIETAPRDTPILLSIFASGDPERERLVVVGGSSDGVTWIDHYDYEIHPPTHWMPLPSAPSTKLGVESK